MPRASQLLAVGLTFPQTRAIVGASDTGVTATGTTLATAYNVVAPITICTTVAASSGVVLPVSNTPGDSFVVFNGGANALTVYAPSGGKVNALAAGVGYSVPVSNLARFTCIDPAGLNFATG